MRILTAKGEGRAAAMPPAAIEVGGYRVDGVRVIVNEAPMPESLLGMSFLDRLAGYEVRGDNLVLRWR